MSFSNITSCYIMTSTFFSELCLAVVLILMGGKHTATQCPDEACCYLYTSIPDNLTCNPQGQSRYVLLQCVLYTPNSTVGRVRWYYKSAPEKSASIVSVEDFDANTAIPVDSGPYSGLKLAKVSSNLNIGAFNCSFNGYYWCQLEVNNTCFQPSPSGYVEFSSTYQNNCSSGDIIVVGRNLLALKQKPICISGYSSECEEQSPTPLTPLSTATANSSIPSTDEDFTTILGYGVVGVLLFLSAMLSAAITLFVSVRLSKRCAVKSNDLLDLKALVHHQSSPNEQDNTSMLDLQALLRHQSSPSPPSEQDDTSISAYQPDDRIYLISQQRTPNEGMVSPGKGKVTLGKGKVRTVNYGTWTVFPGEGTVTPKGTVAPGEEGGVIKREHPPAV